MRERFFFNDTATTEIYTLSLHDALPILGVVAPLQGYVDQGVRHEVDAALGQESHELEGVGVVVASERRGVARGDALAHPGPDRKSTRLNSSHANISYAVFCLKKKNIVTL